MRARAVIAATALFTLAGPAFTSQAWAFARRPSSAGVPARWPGSCVPLTIYPNGYTGMTRDEIAKSIAAAARTWGPDAVACADGTRPYLELVAGMADDGAVAPRIAYDRRNTIAFDVDGWSGSSELEVALTLSVTQPGGEIVDTDLRINASTFSFANLDPGSSTQGQNGAFDLQHVITHELGHLIGLDHTCLLAGDDLGPVDDAGNLVPYCADASATLLETTMFPRTDPGRTSFRSLAADDIRAVCTIYPAGADPRSCALDLPDDGCGCTTAGASPGGLLTLLALFAFALSRARPRPAGSRLKPRPAWCSVERRAPAP